MIHYLIGLPEQHLNINHGNFLSLIFSLIKYLATHMHHTATKLVVLGNRLPYRHIDHSEQGFLALPLIRRFSSIGLTSLLHFLRCLGNTLGPWLPCVHLASHLFCVNHDLPVRDKYELIADIANVTLNIRARIIRHYRKKCHYQRTHDNQWSVTFTSLSNNKSPSRFTSNHRELTENAIVYSGHCIWDLGEIMRWFHYSMPYTA